MVEQKRANVKHLVFLIFCGILISMDEQIYKENILDRYKHPRHKGSPEKYDIREGAVNASCGDSMLIFLSFDENGKVKEAHFDGEGCAISQAAADMLLDKVIGMTAEDIGKIQEKEIYDMLGIEIGPSREKCAMISINTLRRWLGENMYGVI